MNMLIMPEGTLDRLIREEGVKPTVLARNPQGQPTSIQAYKVEVGPNHVLAGPFLSRRGVYNFMRSWGKDVGHRFERVESPEEIRAKEGVLQYATVPVNFDFYPNSYTPKW